MKKNIYIGMSGWSYRDWTGIFYPAEIRSTAWLATYSKHYNTTEVNSSFYHIPREKTVLNWIENVPASFRFCPKMSKYLTHNKKLKEPEEPLERFFKAFEQVKKFLGPVLIQLPPSLTFDAKVVTHLFEILDTNYHSYEFALEARNKSWINEDVFNLLKKFNIAWVISQSGVGYPYQEQATSRNIYIRLHGPDKLYASTYSDDALQQYAIKIKAWVQAGHKVWVYFNNTIGGIALANADTLKKMLGIK